MGMLNLILNKSIFILFGICFFIIVFSFINRLYILFLYKRTTSIDEPTPQSYFKELPKVTVQLPIFNESAVVQRLINNICALDYPADKLEIQVLDDSTDNTKEIAFALCEKMKAKGINIKHIWRQKREGYKAGALQHGLSLASGEFVAIFDSDFLPQADFLKRTIHFFSDDKIGWVQTRWSHLNENFSLLTQCIALMCDSLFRVENSARSKLNHWGIFNGTAGVIRRKMIDEAGGWHWDTITEDSDLSYRALTKGWQYLILSETACPCELPPSLPIFIEQQIRWSKGNMQVIKKLLSRIMSADVSLVNKYDFIAYTTYYFFFPALTIFSLLIMPNVLLNLNVAPHSSHLITLVNGFMIGLAGMLGGVAVLFSFLKLGQRKQNKKTKYVLIRTLVFMFMSVGLSPFIAIAIFEGFFKKDREFIRTPKYDLTDKNIKLFKKTSASNKVRFIAKICIMMGLYCLVSILVCCYVNFEATAKYLPLLVLFSCAYSYFGILIAFPEQRLFKNIFEFKERKIKDLEESVVV